MAGKARTSIALHRAELCAVFLSISRQFFWVFCLSDIQPLAVLMLLKSRLSNPLAVCCDVCLPIVTWSSPWPCQHREDKNNLLVFRFPWPLWVFRYFQREVLWPRPCCLGGLGEPDPRALAPGWVPAWRAAALGEGLVLAPFSRPPAVWDHPCCALVERADRVLRTGGSYVSMRFPSPPSDPFVFYNYFIMVFF